MSMPHVKTQTINVDIWADPKGPNGIGFALNEGFGRVQRVAFSNGNHPGVLVYFKIDDDKKAPTGLLFRPDPRDALWVAQGSQDPVAGAQWPGFVPLSVENGRRKLLVYCRNESPAQQFKFTLWFLDPQGLAIPYDPIGDGLNGPRGSF
jgi:hypothetical protein